MALVSRRHNMQCIPYVFSIENSDFSYALKFVTNAPYDIFGFEYIARLFQISSVLVLLFAREDRKKGA
jgi:hypothetical protein